MKTICSFFILFFSLSVSAQNKLTIVVDGIENKEGKLWIAIYNSKDTFLKKLYLGSMVEIIDETCTAVFENVPSGKYVVSVYQDENNNGKLDSNFLGIPKEKYGFSNNVKGKMGPPSFEETSFVVEDNITQYITL